MSLYTLLFLGTTPIGGLVTGALADRFGIQVALGIEAAICTMGVGIGGLYVISARSRPRAAPETSGESGIPEGRGHGTG